MERRTFLKTAALTLGSLLLDAKISPNNFPEKQALEREAKIILKVDNLEFTYFGSNIKPKGNQIIFGRGKGKDDAYQILDSGKIIGPYQFVHFAFSDSKLNSYQIFKEKPSFKVKEQDLYRVNYDYYSGLLTVFSQEYGKLVVKKYTFEPTLPIPALFYPKKREFFDAWEIVETASDIRKGNRVSNQIKNFPLVIDLEKTLAYIYESFPFQID